MAIYSRGRLELAKQLKERDQISPERTKVWSEPRSNNSDKRKVPVVYYLSRNGHLDHPHFIEVSLSSRHDRLYLKDVINRLNVLRGKGMASMYSWSSKRSYNNRFVWQDLCEDDFIYPAHGNDYVLKGSELLGVSPSSPHSASSSSTSEQALEIPKMLKEKTQKSSQWSSIDLNEYMVYKSELIADAATQTDDKMQRRRMRAEIQEISHSSDSAADREEIIEISPPPSSSSPETLESLIKPGGRLIADEQDRTVSNCSSGRFRASAVLMQIVSCGSISVKENATRGGLDSGRMEMDGPIGGSSSFGSMRFEDKEYFSGSLIEIKKKSGGGAMLKRSNSYNADRSSKLGLAAAKEIDVARAKCIPRKTNKITTAATGAGRRERCVVVGVGSNGEPN